MTQLSPIIQDGVLTDLRDGSPVRIVVDSSDWYAWLQTASTFTFRGEHGSFTAHKERAGHRRGRLYWRAYRTWHGKLHRAYLGQSEELTLERLQSVAVVLASEGAGETSLDGPGLGAGTGSSADAPSRARSHRRRATEAQGSHEAARSTPWLASFPVPLSALVGREQEVRVIGELLAHPEVRLLVTSRAALHLSGEHEFPVSPLAVPDLTQQLSPEMLTQQAAVRLFVLRTQAIQPAFGVTPANARAIAEICVHLDGLPLAIELAAARSKLLPPQALLKRLSHRLEVLTGGAQDLPARQQTLRNTLQWSYDLLTQQEQRLFRWLSIFVGGCT